MSHGYGSEQEHDPYQQHADQEAREMAVERFLPANVPPGLEDDAKESGHQAQTDASKVGASDRPLSFPDKIMKIDRHKTESEWLEARRKGCGSSDIADLVFESTFRGPWTIWAEKTGKHQAQQDDNPLCEIGHRSEDMNSKWFAEVTGKRLYDPGNYTMIWHESLPMFATVDRLALSDDKKPRLGGSLFQKFVDVAGSVVELKACFGELARVIEKATTNDLHHTKLQRWLYQVQHQLACTGLQEGYLSILYFTGFNAGHRWFHCRRDERVIAAIEKRVADFWQCVESGTPPDWELARAADMEAIKALNNGTSGEYREVEGLKEQTAFSGFLNKRQKALDTKKVADEAKAKMAAYMATIGAEELRLGEQRIYQGKRGLLVGKVRE